MVGELVKPVCQAWCLPLAQTSISLRRKFADVSAPVCYILPSQLGFERVLHHLLFGTVDSNVAMVRTLHCHKARSQNVKVPILLVAAVTVKQISAVIIN